LIDKWRFRQLCARGWLATMAAMPNSVTLVPAAPPEIAIEHFESELTFQTDCWDTHEAMHSADPGFVLLDVRSPALFAKGHVPGAINLPHGKIVASLMNAYPRATLFVTYCAGPHCNGAARGAARLARLGHAVKIMAGGVTGWIDEGFELERGAGTP
jgi:rhodanese-related sulfurtransferase